MGFHALHCHDKHGVAINGDSGVLQLDSSLGATSGPEYVSHGAPGVLNVVSIEGGAVLSKDHSRSQSGHHEFHLGLWVHLRRKSIGFVVVTRADNGQVLSVEIGALNTEILQSSGCPSSVRVGGAGIVIEQAEGKLRGGFDAHNIRVDYLSKSGVTRSQVGEVEGLGLHVGGGRLDPGKILNDGISRNGDTISDGVGHGVNSLGAVFGLGSASHNR